MLYLVGSVLSLAILLSGCGGETCCNSDAKVSSLQNVTLGESLEKLKPKPVISNIKGTCIVGETFGVDGFDSLDKDGEVVSYQWTFEDQNASSKDPIFTCAHQGEQNLCLKVTDDDGLSDQNCTTITGTLNKPQTLPPVAIISMEDSRVEDGKVKSIYLDCSKSYDPDFVDGDQNSSNDKQILKAVWSMYKTINGERQDLHTKDICRKWVGLNDDLDSIEITLEVIDDDGESSSVTQVYDYDGERLNIR